MMKRIKTAIEEILEYIYPSSIYCICCGKIIDRSRSYSLCDQCMEAINWATGKSCGKCGKPLEDTWHNELCSDCMKGDHHFDRGYTCCQYGLYSRTIIFSYKYDNNNYIGSFLGQAMADRIGLEDLEWQVTVPVPTEKEKERMRGFDHAYLLAKVVGELTGKRVCPALKRTKKTIAQRGLSPEMRRSNIEGSIKINGFLREDIKDKDILLIDDIYTTGATADECCRVLKEQGAKRVYLLTFAAGGNMHGNSEEP